MKVKYSCFASIRSYLQRKLRFDFVQKRREGVSGEQAITQSDPYSIFTLTPNNKLEGKSHQLRSRLNLVENVKAVFEATNEDDEEGVDDQFSSSKRD